MPYLALSVHVHELGEVEARPLHHLHLPDVHVVQGVDALNEKIYIRTFTTMSPTKSLLYSV
jgi:hypothetical protein